ncbi:hypothetical protein AGMMS50225_27840 [Betaproteobacteria bacterium]|nr:hypothetical protein AGMMS50225_27840 [Betaproteobacteria bacterium]
MNYFKAILCPATDKEDLACLAAFVYGKASHVIIILTPSKYK